MKTIVVASRLAGSGKSTLACQIAAAAQALEYSPAVVVDMARDGAARRWGAARSNRPPCCVHTTADGLPGLIARLSLGGTALVVIDTAPFQLVSSQAAIVMADLVLIPTAATRAGVDAARHTSETARRAGTPALIAINALADLPHRDVLSSLQEIAPVARTVIRRHRLMADCLAGGGTVFEREPFGDVSRDLHELWSTMAFMLERAERPLLPSAAE